MTDTAHRASFFRQSGWLMFATVASGMFMLGVHLLSHRMPKGEYGEFVAFLSVAMFIPAMPLQMVLAQQTARALALHREHELSGLIRAAWLGTFLVWLVAVVVVLLFQRTIPNGPIDPTPIVAMVGLIEKPEHITTQWFKDEGDIILLLGEAVDQEDPLRGLGGSAYLQCLHGLKAGVPPRCDLEKEARLHHTLLGFIQCGQIKSAHDCSEGGLAVALAESCISRQIARETPRLIGATIDLTSVAPENTPAEALLFGETQSRVVISVAPGDVVKVVERARILGVPAARIGTVGGVELSIKLAGVEVRHPLTELHDLWWNAIDRAMSGG